MDEELFDVVIYELGSWRVDSVVGENMRRDSGHYNAEKRLATALGRINDAYDARIVPAGLYLVGSILPDGRRR